MAHSSPQSILDDVAMVSQKFIVTDILITSYVNKLTAEYDWFSNCVGSRIFIGLN